MGSDVVGGTLWGQGHCDQGVGHRRVAQARLVEEERREGH